MVDQPPRRLRADPPGCPESVDLSTRSHKPNLPPVASPGPAVPGSGPVQRERRDPAHQRTLIGGHRASDPPLTTRDCADWMGVGTDFIRGAIEDGQLQAEDVRVNGKRLIRIHLVDFVTYLRAIGWKRLPRVPGE